MIDFMAVGEEKASRQGNFQSSSYFSLNDGESKYVRFLTALEPYLVVDHQCGVHQTEIQARVWEENKQTGQPTLCPQCGQPLTDSDIVYRRPEVIGANLHRFVQCNDGNKGTFVCLGSADNAKYGWVPANADGSPQYNCPICPSQGNINKQTGKPKAPSFRIYGVVVEREAVTETQMVNGIPKEIITGVHDVLVTEDDGTVHPKVSIIEMGFKGFWQKVDLANNRNRAISISYFDWKITRQGSGLDTTYDVVRKDETQSAFDMREYEQWMPDISGMVTRLGSPEYYTNRGWGVVGYIPPADNTETAQEPAQPAVGVPVNTQPQVGYNPPSQPVVGGQMPQAMAGEPTQPVNPMGQAQSYGQPVPPEVAAGNDWSVVSGQVQQ